jgi:hypothetical protein
MISPFLEANSAVVGWFLRVNAFLLHVAQVPVGEVQSLIGPKPRGNAEVYAGSISGNKLICNLSNTLIDTISNFNT